MTPTQQEPTASLPSHPGDDAQPGFRLWGHVFKPLTRRGLVRAILFSLIFAWAWNTWVGAGSMGYPGRVASIGVMAILIEMGGRSVRLVVVCSILSVLVGHLVGSLVDSLVGQIGPFWKGSA